MEKGTDFRFDEVEHKVALKRHQQKLFEFYKDLKSYKPYTPNQLNQPYQLAQPNQLAQPYLHYQGKNLYQNNQEYSWYPGTTVTFNFELDIEVFKLV